MNRIFREAALIIPLALVCLIAAPVNAQEQKSVKKVEQFSPIGTWNWERISGDSTIKCKLVVNKKKGDEFFGKYEDKEHKLEIKNAKLKDGEFSFELAPHPESPDKLVKFKGKMAPESIKGKMSYSIGDQDQAMQWNAKRFDPMNAATGKWTLEFVTPDDLEVSFTIKVQKKGKGLSVDFVDDDSVDVSHVKFKKNVLSFDSEQVYQGIPVTVEWDVKLDDDLVDGVLYYSFDNEQGEGELTVTGERVD